MTIVYVTEETLEKMESSGRYYPFDEPGWYVHRDSTGAWSGPYDTKEEALNS